MLLRDILLYTIHLHRKLNIQNTFNIPIVTMSTHKIEPFKEPIRRSSRTPVPVGTKIEMSKPRDVHLPFVEAEECESHLPRPSDPQLSFEKSEKWDSHMAPCHQVGLHGRVPSNKPDTKRLTMREGYVSTLNKEN
jgi:hypothetical protein